MRSATTRRISKFPFAYHGLSAHPGLTAKELYRGVRTKQGCVVTVSNQPLPLRLDLHNKSPSGFEWGYCGSGPAQLALAILAYHCASTEQRALDNYQAFKHQVIVHIPSNMWTMNGEFIENVLLQIASEHSEMNVKIREEC